MIVPETHLSYILLSMGSTLTIETNYILNLLDVLQHLLRSKIVNHYYMAYDLYSLKYFVFRQCLVNS